jgi:hypothetical protein
MKSQQHVITPHYMNDPFEPTGRRWIGYKCSCGGHWYRYQNPYHLTIEQKREYDESRKKWDK